MPKEERNKVNKTVLSETAGNLLIRMAGEFVFLSIAFYFQLTWVGIAVLSIIMIGFCITLFVTSKKITESRTTKRRTAITTAFIILVTVFIGFQIY